MRIENVTSYVDKSVFDHSNAGLHVNAERFDEAGAEDRSPELDSPGERASGESGTRSGFHVAEGRNDDKLLRNAADNGKSYYWNPQPPRSNSSAIRCF